MMMKKIQLGRGLVNTASSPHVRLRSVDMNDVQWTHGFWADKFDQCARVMVPNMWRLLSNTEVSFAYHNFLLATGRAEGHHRGPKWNDGDFYKWLEAADYRHCAFRLVVRTWFHKVACRMDGKPYNVPSVLYRAWLKSAVIPRLQVTSSCALV